MDTEFEPLQVLAKALNNLLAQRNKDGHWGDVRSSSLALWALNEGLLSFDTLPDSLSVLRKEVEEVNRWLCQCAKLESPGYSWESEAWDTALAIIALSHDASYGERIDQATHWLESIRGSNTGVWYDEVWETTLSTIALLRSQRIRRMPDQYEEWSWIQRVFTWLMEIPSKHDGEFVCPHYSGFMVWLMGEVQNSPAARQIIETAVFQDFKRRADEALQWLLSNLEPDNVRLWSPYTFSVSYIVIGLCSLRLPIDSQKVQTLVRWFKDKQSHDGGFEDIEDTSLAVLALSSIVQLTQGSKQSIVAHISLPAHPKKCFLGYCARASTVALELKEHLKNTLPAVSIADWKSDFWPGHVLFEEIRKASVECQVAIFLVTEDDAQIESQMLVLKTPRDNIIFEYGYFAAKNGIEKTILVVEDRAKMPSDLGGIIYVPMPDRKNIEGVKIQTERALRKIFRL
jgi:hypothetical protein